MRCTNEYSRHNIEDIHVGLHTSHYDKHPHIFHNQTNETYTHKDYIYIRNAQTQVHKLTHNIYVHEHVIQIYMHVLTRTCYVLSL